jgi:type IV secretion system protein VirB5
MRVAVVCTAIASSTTASAQIPVTDIAAIAQLIAQLQELEEQLAVARDQLEQARSLYASMTGGRGMQHLLEGVARNYLPADWQSLLDAMQGVSAAYSLLGADVRAPVAANAILSEQQLAALDPGDRAELQAARGSSALLESLSRQALASTSERFDAIQEFIDAIGSADDQKAILDLQARISAEQNMLSNEANKLHVLAQATQSQQQAHQQRQLERRIAGIGSWRELDPMGL